MLTALSNDILGLIFDQLSCSDQIATRAVCQSLRQYYRHHRMIKLRKDKKKYDIAKKTWEEFVNFYCYARLTFQAKGDNPKVKRAINTLYQETPELESEETTQSLTEILTKALCKHPPQTIIGDVKHYNDQLYLLSAEGILYRDHEIIFYHVERFHVCIGGEYIICGGNNISVSVGDNILEFVCNPEVLMADRYIVYQNQILYLSGSSTEDREVLPVTGWSFPMGIIDLACSGKRYT